MKKEMICVIMVWLFVIGCSCWWNITEAKKANEQLAFGTARAFFQQVVTTRAWNARHGGVYAPITKDVRPNPYLDDPLRDLSTDKNINLTKLNPAYMTRQIADIASENEYNVQFHITSLKPIRPQNKAVEWEKKFLKSFELGKKEGGTFFTEGQNTGFRYMAPLMVKDSCIKCHAKQGYKKGDIRGGISVTLPNFSEKKNSSLLIGYAIVAFLVVVLIIFGGTLLEKKELLLLKANQSLKNEIEEHQRVINQLKEASDQVKKLSGIIPICSNCKKIRDDKGYWNQLEKFISDNSEALFSHGICDECMKKYYSEDME
ncbi:MAG: DUF3365 domain-containing protein [Desulfobacteraceae bacterium]|nr:DUF3365 domain-containing protein [Desulfobacteraceae bacterium]